MAIDSVRELCHATAFQPFTIRLTDGRAISVPHRDFIAIGPRGRTVIVYDEQERFSIIDVPLITQIELGNGQRP